MNLAWMIVLVIALFIAVVILNARPYGHRLAPPEADKDAKLLDIRRYDATDARLLPLVLLVDALFLGTFLWLTFQVR